MAQVLFVSSFDLPTTDLNTPRKFIFDVNLEIRNKRTLIAPANGRFLTMPGNAQPKHPSLLRNEMKKKNE
jgi:hypothetical protein